MQGAIRRAEGGTFGYAARLVGIPRGAGLLKPSAAPSAESASTFGYATRLVGIPRGDGLLIEKEKKNNNKNQAPKRNKKKEP